MVQLGGVRQKLGRSLRQKLYHNFWAGVKGLAIDFCYWGDRFLQWPNMAQTQKSRYNLPIPQQLCSG